jgi:hypothetical protein
MDYKARQKMTGFVFSESLFQKKTFTCFHFIHLSLVSFDLLRTNNFAYGQKILGKNCSKL